MCKNGQKSWIIFLKLTLSDPAPLNFSVRNLGVLHIYHLHLIYWPSTLIRNPPWHSKTSLLCYYKPIIVCNYFRWKSTMGLVGKSDTRHQQISVLRSNLQKSKRRKPIFVICVQKTSSSSGVGLGRFDEIFVIILCLSIYYLRKK